MNPTLMEHPTRTIRTPARLTKLAAACLALLLILCALSRIPVHASEPAALHDRPPVQSFIWVGNGDRGFTDEELHYIAAHYSLVVFSKFHGKWNIETQNHDARRLKELNPQIKVFVYYSMSYRFKQDRFGTDTFQEKWVLHDSNSGAMVPFVKRPKRDSSRREPTQVGWVMDLGQKEYRDWALGILAGWLAAAPYDGVAFDSVVPINMDPRHMRRQLEDVSLSREAVDAWNEGIKQMLTAAAHLGGRHREVIFNGIADKSTFVNRNLDLLNYADTALNEEFCMATPHGERRQVLPRHALEEEIKLMMHTAGMGKQILEKTNYRSDKMLEHLRIDKSQLSRFCYGVFLMGYTPGRHFFKFGPGYDARDGELTENASEVAIPLGAPVGSFESADGVWVRRFEHGVVYVNPDRGPRKVTLDRALVRMNGDMNRGSVARGSSVTVPARDALYFLDEGATAPQAATDPCGAKRPGCMAASG